MRQIISIAMLVIGCASTAQYVNVAKVRNEIRDAIHATGSPRDIVSMGKTARDHAVVYTQTDKTAPRAEEEWTKDATGWHLEHTATIAPVTGVAR